MNHTPPVIAATRLVREDYEKLRPGGVVYVPPPKRVKPHIRNMGHGALPHKQWACWNISQYASVGYGETPEKAYSNWAVAYLRSVDLHGCAHFGHLPGFPGAHR